MFRSFIAPLLLGLWLGLGCSSAEAAPPLTFDDQPETLIPRPRSEAEEDRVEATALFAAARTYEKRGNDAAALRLYQRAHRFDPDATAIVQAIVPLAYRQNRVGEALRYAMKVAEFDDGDPLLLRRLGVLLSDRGDWAGAVTLYERALEARGEDESTAADVLLQMEIGRLYFLADEHAKAAKAFDRVRDALDRPKDFGIDDKIRDLLVGEAGATYTLMGDVYLRADRPADALTAFERAHQVAPADGVLAFRRAQVLAHRQKTDEAIAALNEYFDAKLDSEGIAPYELLAELLERQGKKTSLVGRLEELRRDMPKNVPLGYYLAESYAEAGSDSKAADLYAEVVVREPTVNGLRAWVGLLHKHQRYDDLRAALAAVIEHTGLLETLEEELDRLVDDGKTLDELTDRTRAAIKTKPDDVNYRERLAVGLLLLKAGRFEPAAEMLELAMKADEAEPADVLLDWGMGLLGHDLFAEAAAVFQRGIDEKALPADNPLFHFYLAGALGLAEKADESLTAATKAAALRPQSARFRSRIGWAHYRAKRYEQAIAAYNELLDRFADDYKSEETREVVRDTRLVLSNLYVLQDQLPEAEEQLELVLDEYPDDVGALNDLGYLWADQGKRLQRSLQMIQQALKEEPDNAAYRDSLGWVYFRLGRHAEAVAELEKAAGDKPDAVVLEHLGDAYHAAGRLDDATSAYRRAAAAFREEKEEAKAVAVEKKLEKKLEKAK